MAKKTTKYFKKKIISYINFHIITISIIYQFLKNSSILLTNTIDPFEVSSSSQSSNRTIDYCNSVLSIFDRDQDLFVFLYFNNCCIRCFNLCCCFYVLVLHIFILFFSTRSLSLSMVLTRPIINKISLFT